MNLKYVIMLLAAFLFTAGSGVSVAAAGTLEDSHAKVCLSSMKLMEAACELATMDGVTGELTLKTLVEKKYIEQMPSCPDNGGYLIKRTGDISFDISCSSHGKLSLIGSLKSDKTPGKDQAYDCGSERNIIISAFELYLIDNPGCVVPEMFEKVVNNELVQKEYLKSRPVCPAGGLFSYNSSLASGKNIEQNVVSAGNKKYVVNVSCSVHGGFDLFLAEREKRKRNSSESEKKAGCLSDMRTVTGALELYFMEHDKNASSIDELIAGGYLKYHPVCYSNGTYEVVKNASNANSCTEIKCSVHGKIEESK